MFNDVSENLTLLSMSLFKLYILIFLLVTFVSHSPDIQRCNFYS